MRRRVPPIILLAAALAAAYTAGTMSGDSTRSFARGAAKPHAVRPPDLVHYTLTVAGSNTDVTVTERGWVKRSTEGARRSSSRFRLTADELAELLRLMRAARLGGHAFVDSPDGDRHFVGLVPARPPKMRRVVRNGEVFFVFYGGSGTRQASFSPEREDDRQRPPTDAERELIEFLRELAEQRDC